MNRRLMKEDNFKKNRIYQKNLTLNNCNKHNIYKTKFLSNISLHLIPQ